MVKLDLNLNAIIMSKRGSSDVGCIVCVQETEHRLQLPARLAHEHYAEGQHLVWTST